MVKHKMYLGSDLGHRPATHAVGVQLHTGVKVEHILLIFECFN